MLEKNTIKHFANLQRKKFRNEYKEYVVEGEKMVKECIQWCKDDLVKVYCLPDFQLENDLSSIPHQIVSERELKQLSTLKTPNKAVALLKHSSNELQEASFYLVLDGIQDPGNMGTIIRLADWFGLTQIICSLDTVDCYNPKVVQATMGSLFRINVHYTVVQDFLQGSQLPVYGALLNGENVYEQTLKKEGILLMGNEGNGIREELLPFISHPLMIPRFGEAESLNVGIATSILLSEFSRGARV